MFRFARWSASALFGTWVAWWAALIGVTLGPGLVRAVRLARQPGNHGSFSASVDGGRLLFKVVDGAGPTGTWTLGTSVWTALAWIAVPPLALWVVWLISRPRRPGLSETHPPLIAEVGTPSPPVQQRANAERVERQW